MASVAFCTLGCKVNQYETDVMRERFLEAGYEIRDFEQEADIYVINTCTVTNIADRKSRQMLRRARKRNPQALVIAAGCYVDTTQEALAGERIADLLIGNKEKERIVEIVSRQLGVADPADIIPGESTEGVCPDPDKRFTVGLVKGAGERLRSHIKIQDGCNQFCSYCAIPLARGRVVSRRQEDIAAEAARLAAQGCPELVLTGIHISSYGLDLIDKSALNTNQRKEPGQGYGEDYGPFAGDALISLIEETARVCGDIRIRLGSLEPRIITDSFLQRLSAVKQVCPHFHLSLQSGCGETLKRMNRHYSPALYLEKCDLIRKYYDFPAITTDVIVGFPGETQEEFEETLAFVQKVGFSNMHIFRYSRRDGTRAASMSGQVDPRIMAERSQKLIEAAARMRRSFMEDQKGKEAEVLIEEMTDTPEGLMAAGYSRNYLRCVFSEQGLVPGMLVKGKIHKIFTENIAFCKEIH